MKALIILLILFELVFCSGTKGKFYRCGFDQNKVEPIKLKNPEIKSGKKPSFKRKLDDDGFEDLKIHFDFVNLKSDFEKYSISTSNQTLIIKCINKAIQTLESLLKALPPYNIYFSTEQIQSTGIEKWNETFPMFGDNSYMGIANLGIDLVLFGKMDDTLDDDVFGSGDYCFLDYYNDRPIAGILTINSKIDLSKNNSERFLTTVFLHEITHILGFDVNYIHNYLQQFLQKRDSQGRLHNYITSEKVIEVAKKYYKCNEIEGIELEDFTNSIRGYSHWDARYLLGEYMTDGFYTEEEVISEFTLAFLEGSGKYKVKYYTGGLMQFGKGKGCGFLENTCIDKSTEKTYPGFKNEFFDNVQAKRHVDYIYYDAACTSGRQSRAYHFFLRYSAMESQYIYFQDNIVGYKYSNGCPVSKGADYELDMDYYIGHCSSLGSAGDYGLHLVYGYNTTGKVGSNSILITQQEYSNSSKYYAPYTGETYSDHSFCYQSSLYKKEEEFNEVITRAVCYETFCSNRSLTIKIFDDYFVCPRQGGKLSVEGYRGVFFCPDYYLLCSGTVMCNDMYDCIEKKSETKEESYNLDYTPETNQILSEVENSAFNLNDNYELSDNGKCPKYCKMCKENRKCVLCKEDYYFLGYKGSEEIDCIDLEEINNGGYYQKDDPNLYYKCMDNCQICEEENLCKKCFDGYIYTLNKCLKEIDNCKEYSDDGKCSACSDNYAFEEDNREECFNIEENFEEYYTKDNGISYYPCDSQVSNCNKCYYNSQEDKANCYLCNTDYILFIVDLTCLAQNTLDNSYLKINDTHIDLCANIPGYIYTNEHCFEEIDNCKEYSDDGKCSACNDNYAFKEDNREECFNIEEDFENYYTKDNGISYYPCSNEIINCTKCYYNSQDVKVKCYLCETTYVAFIGNSSCLAKNILDNSYLNINETHVDLCSNTISNCNKCTNENTCIKCSEGFYMLNDDYKNCISLSEIKTDEYYLSEDGSNYLSCNDSNYNDIQNCKKCSSKTDCSLCQETFTFVNGDKSQCVAIDSLNNKYSEDPEDISNYIKCENIYAKCDTCNKERCLTCQEKYAFLNDDYSICLEIPPTTIPPTIAPTNKPTIAQEITQTNKPDIVPTNKPVEEQTNKQVEEPTNKPVDNPTNKPVEEQTNKPVEEITNKPGEQPTNKPIEEATNKPVEQPTNKPVEEATNKPVEEATNKPGDVSTDKPEEMKTNKPKDEPTNKPDIASTNESIKDSTNKQMEEPTNKPEEEPSNKQIEIQTNKPYIKPTNKQDVVPTNIPDIIQTNKPLEESSIKPDNEKTNKPGEESTDKPGEVSSNKPDEEPTNKPNNVPTNKPAEELTNKPVEEETNKQLGESTDKPVVQSTNKIDDESTNKPLEVTTNKQINEQTNKPGEIPTYKPDIVPTNKPGEEPTHKSIEVPTYKQDEEKTSNPIEEPTNKTNKPGEESSNKLDEEPTNKQGEEPTHKPSVGPTDMPIKIPTNKPDNEPTNKQDNEPTNKPDNEPTNKPVEELTDKKVEELTDKPGEETTNKPNNESTNKPLEVPTNKPIDEPTDKQGEESTNKPNNEPTNKPVEVPTNKPVVVPTNKPIDDTTYKPNIEPTTKSNIEPTNKQNDEQTNKPNVEPINAPTSKPVIDDEEDEDDNGTPVISKEDALKKANISLSYEKINNFNNNKEEKKISYDLSVLTSVGELKIGHEIKVNVNLIYSNGTRSSEATESICTVQNIEEQGTSARATFLCTIENLEGDYYSLRYNNSESICGVPKDEISLDPVMTKKYKNNEDTKIVPFFTFESIEHNNCETTGMFTIIGKMSDKIQEKVPKFVLPLTYPEGTSLTCESNEDQDKLSCKVDRDIKNKTIIIEQTTITQENVKYFTLKSIATQEKLVCSNAILKESLAKINASISFRQVSHFNNDNNGLSFILIGFVSEKLEQGVSMSVNVYLNDEKTDRNLDCILENNVDPENGQVQGNFLCSAEKSTSDFWNSVDFTTASVSLSPNNSNIGGVAELDEISANPAKTDEEIKKIKDKKQNNEAINALSNVIDYYEEETAINTLNLESIDADKCNTTGKLTIKGSFLDDFEEELNFDLPLVYPNTELKCQINKATANTVIEIICKTKTEFKSVDSIVIEPRIIKKKNKELFLIQGKSFTLNGKRSCEKYDTIRSKTLEQRENSGISFSLVGALEIVNQALEFFLGLARKSEDIPFDAIYTFVTSLMVLTRRNLRTLEESTISDIPMTCKLNESLIVGLIGGYDCISDTKNIQGTPLSMKMSTDDIMNIAGIDNIDLQSITSNDGIDYSNLAFLEKINALPQVYINNINGDSCAENGQYIIYGNISDDSEVEAYYSDIEIIISSTESKGLCEVEINKEKKNLTMICQNSDKFDISQIMIAKSFVKNSTNNFIFVINSYTSPEQFSCDVSLNSVKSTVADNENNNKYYRYNLKATNTNLSAGAIVAIIIPIIILIIALIIILVLMRKGKLFNKKAKDTQESTMQRLRNIS